LESKAQQGVGEKDQILSKVQKEVEDWKSQVTKLQDNQSSFEKTKKTLESQIQDLKDTLEEETSEKQKFEKQKKKPSLLKLMKIKKKKEERMTQKI